MQHPQIIISGYYGFENYGDELIGQQIARALLERNYQPVILSINPAKTTASFLEQGLNVKAIHRMNVLTILKALLTSKALISGGGGLFQDSTSLKSPIYYGGLMALARLCNTPVVVFGQGIGPLKTALGKQITRLAFSLCNQFWVRDSASLDWLKHYLPSKAACSHQMVDPVWATPIATNAPANSSTQHAILVSLRPSKHLDASFLNKLAELIANLNQQHPNTPIVLVAAQAEEDLPVLEQFKTVLQQQFPNLPVSIAPHITPGLLQHCLCVVAMRLHVLLMALKHQKPCLGIAYDPKVHHLCQATQTPAVALTNWHTHPLDELPFPQFSAEAVSSQVEQVQTSYKQLLNWIDEREANGFGI